MAGAYQLTFNLPTGEKLAIPLFCPAKKEPCLLSKAQKAHEAFIDAILDLEWNNMLYGERLQMAKFTRTIVKSATKSFTKKGKKSKADEIWERLTTSRYKGESTSYDNTWLKSDVEMMEKKLKDCQKKINTTGDALVKILKSKKFHNHMHIYHRNRTLPNRFVKMVYGVDPPAAGPKVPKYREIDHFMAVLTENLAIHEKGRKEILEKMADPTWLKNHKAFADVWGYLGKFHGTTESVGKFLHNWSPIISLKAQELINAGGVKTAKAIMNNTEIKKHLDLLKKHRKQSNPLEWLGQKAAHYEKGAKRAAWRIRKRGQWKSAINAWMKPGGREFDQVFTAKMKKAEWQGMMNVAWIKLTFDGVAFILSSAAIVSNIKDAKGKDFLGAANDLMGLTKTVLEHCVEPQMRMQGLALRVDAYGAKAKGLKQASHAFRLRARAVTMRADRVAAWAKWLGVAGCLINAFFAGMSTHKAYKRGDWKELAIHGAGVALAVSGAVAIIMGASMASGILAIVGFIFAIIVTLVSDTPLENYIEDIEWGIRGYRHNIKVKDTIIGYYKLYNMRMKYIVVEADNNESYIDVKCSLMSDITPIFIEVVTVNHKRKAVGLIDTHRGPMVQYETIVTEKSVGRFRTFPGMKYVRRKIGRVKKEGYKWDNPHLKYIKELSIKDIWDIIPGRKIIRDGKTRYTIRAGIDPSNNPTMKIKKMAVNTSISGVKFPPPQKPILHTPAGLSSYKRVNRTMYLHKGYPWKSRRYIKYPPDWFTVYVYTKYAPNCKIWVTCEVYGQTISNTVPIADKKTKEGFNKTPVKLKLVNPHRGDEYRLNLKYRLLDANNKTLASSSYYVDVAHDDYVEKNRLR